MAKTISLRVDDTTYHIIKMAAAGQKRTMSNYIAYAALNFTLNESFVDDKEMKEIMKHGKDLQKGLDDVSAGRFQLVNAYQSAFPFPRA